MELRSPAPPPSKRIKLVFKAPKPKPKLKLKLRQPAKPSSPVERVAEEGGELVFEKGVKEGRRVGAKEEVVRTSREGRDVTGQGVVKGIWGTKHFPQKRRRGTDERYSGSTQQSLQNPRLSFKSDVRNFVQFEGKEQASVRAGNTVKADPESGTSQTIAREGNWRDSNVSDTSSSTSSESESMDERDDEEEKGVLWKVFLGRYAENGTESIAEAVDASDPNTALEEESQDEYLLKDPRWTCLCTVPKSNVVGLSTKHPSLNCLFYDPPSPEASKRRKAEAVQNIPTTVCLCNAPAKHHSGHPWVFTRKGIRLAKLWRTELMTRRKAYTASYGHSDSLTPVREVMELILDDFTIKTARQPPQILAVWAFVEAMALFLNENVLCLPDRSIDTEQRARIVKMMGDAFLTTVKLLIKQGLFNQAGSPIAPNLGLVLMMFLIYTPRGSNGDVCEQTTANWAEEVTCLAEEYHIRGDHLPNLESKIHTLNKAHDDDTQLQVAKGPAQVIKLTVKRGRDETSLDDDCDLQPVVDDQHQDIVSSQPPNWLSDDQRSQWGFRQEQISRLREIMEANRRPNGALDGKATVAAWNGSYGQMPGYGLYRSLDTLRQRVKLDKRILRKLAEKPATLQEA